MDEHLRRKGTWSALRAAVAQCAGGQVPSTVEKNKGAVQGQGATFEFDTNLPENCQYQWRIQDIMEVGGNPNYSNGHSSHIKINGF